MLLRQLHIINFKSIASASLDLSPKVNCFIGLNGMGKTNILDALHYLAFTRSHLSITDALAVRRDQEAAILEGSYLSSQGDERRLLLQIRPGQRKILRRNKKEYDRLSQHIGAFPLVIVSPQDYQLIQGGSEERRRFVDMQLSQQDSVYMGALAQYHKALTQRNALLKDSRPSDAVLEVLDLQLARAAGYIWQARKAFVESFVPLFAEYYLAIASDREAVGLVYESQLHETQGELYDLLRSSRERDKAIGHTTQGIHRDDLEMTLSGELIRRIGSEGQRKTYLISLKLAQYRQLCLTSSEQPMLLLDDIFDKLDAERVGRIIALVGGEDFGQIFITDTNRKYLDEIVHSWGEDYRLFKVSGGEVSQLH